MVSIKGANFFPGDERIVILGGLDNIASEEQVKEFYKENLESEKIFDDNNEVDMDNLSDASDTEAGNAENDNYLNL